MSAPSGFTAQVVAAQTIGVVLTVKARIYECPVAGELAGAPSTRLADEIDMASVLGTRRRFSASGLPVRRRLWHPASDRVPPGRLAPLAPRGSRATVRSPGGGVQVTLHFRPVSAVGAVPLPIRPKVAEVPGDTAPL